MAVRIIHRKCGTYDVYDRASGKWIVSYNCADNIFSWLAEKKLVYIDFIDEFFGHE